jgi:predicted NACHT family NTPase
MDEGKFIADFIAKNIENIWSIGKSVFEKLDDNIKLQLKSSYKTYLTNSNIKYSQSKSFFIRNKSVDIYDYYVPIGIKSWGAVIEKPSFKNCTDQSKKIVIKGTGGCGKTVLVKHLFLDCMKTKDHVPIFVELRDLNIKNFSLDELVLEILDTLGFRLSDEYIDKAKKEGHFAFFLDGYDEVQHSLRSGLIENIKELSTKYSKCPIIISTRPEDAFYGIDDFQIFDVCALSKKSAVALVQKLPFDPLIKNKFVASLANHLFVKHESFLSNPLLLSIMLLTYEENAEIPPKISIFYNQAFEALYRRHDANKGGYSRSKLTSLDIQEFSRVFALFSLQTYDRRLFKMPRTSCLRYIEKSRDLLGLDFSPEDYLSDLLSAACLLIEDGLEISYSHRSFQEYFVALQISYSSPEIQVKLLERYWTQSNSDSVIFILLELERDLIERELFIPKLQKVLEGIGVVKDTIDKTHLVNFIKDQFDEITIGQYGEFNFLSFDDDKIDRHKLIPIILGNDYAYDPSIANAEGRRKLTNLLLGKYHDRIDRRSSKVKIITSSLTTASPIIGSLVASKDEGLNSLYQLRSLYNVYTKLKEKHKNQTQSIEELLNSNKA